MTDETGSSRGSDENADGGAGGRACPRCGASLYRRHCKYVCPNHGVVMDCADTFHLQRE
jgi:hypothetical protein